MVSDEQLIADLKAFADELGETPTKRQMGEDGPWSHSVYVDHFGSWNQAIKRAGEKPNEEKCYPDSKQELVEDLQEFAEEVVGTPRLEKLREDGPWSPDTYIAHFGSWNNALKQAGFTTNLEHSVKKERLIQDLQVFTDELGETPRLRQMEEDGPWSGWIYTDRFGSWNEALKKVGMSDIREFSDSKDQLIQDLQEFAGDVGETPTMVQMTADGPWSVTTYRKHFGSWNEALEEAGLEPVQESPDSKQELLTDLQKFADELSETPAKRQMAKDGPWSVNTYRRHFGSWNEALEEAGLEPVQEYSDSKQELLVDLQEFSNRIGETPTVRRMNENGPWDSATYRKHFGSWNEALEEAGLEPVEKRSESKEELLEDLQKLADELGETPTREQMNESGPWDARTYANHFGNWTKALKEAGFEPVQDHPVETAWDDDVDDYYGESWSEMREKAVQRDNEQCRVCGDDELLNVHHIKPRRCFENPDESNTLDNLITLCPSCHGRFENRWTDTDPDEFEAKARELLSVA